MILFKELNPEIRKAMDIDKEMYPNTYKRLVDDLQNHNLVGDIQVDTANTLINYGQAVGMDFKSENFVLRLYQIFGR